MQHDCYGRTGYCPPAPPAALIRADLVFALAFIGDPGIARAGAPFALRRADLVVARARRVARDILVMGEPGIARAGAPVALRRADLVVARPGRAPRDILVMGEPGIARAGAPVAFRRADLVFARAQHPCYGQTRLCTNALPAALRRADLVFARARCARAARRATSRLWAKRVWPPRAACCLETGGPGSSVCVPRDIHVMGKPGIACARRLPP